MEINQGMTLREFEVIRKESLKQEVHQLCYEGEGGGSLDPRMFEQYLAMSSEVEIFAGVSGGEKSRQQSFSSEISYLDLSLTWVPESPPFLEGEEERQNVASQVWEGGMEGRSPVIRSPRGDVGTPVMRSPRGRVGTPGRPMVHHRSLPTSSGVKGKEVMLLRRDGITERRFKNRRVDNRSKGNTLSLYLTHLNHIFFLGKCRSLMALLGVCLFIASLVYSTFNAVRYPSYHLGNNLVLTDTKTSPSTSDVTVKQPICSIRDALETDNITDKYFRQNQVYQEKIQVLEGELASQRQLFSERLAEKQETVRKIVRGITEYRESRFFIVKSSLYHMAIFILGAPTLILVGYRYSPTFATFFI